MKPGDRIKHEIFGEGVIIKRFVFKDFPEIKIDADNIIEALKILISLGKYFYDQRNLA
jgi:hypothetical protein